VGAPDAAPGAGDDRDAPVEAVLGHWRTLRDALNDRSALRAE
jgi:hypothetical protein